MKHKIHFVQGLVVFSALLVLIIFLFWLSESDFLFGSSYPLEVKLDSAMGLIDQSKVLMRGYQIGSVKNIRFESDGIILTLSVAKKYPIPEGSTFAVISYNFMGERAIEITPSPSGAPLRPKTQIRGENRDMMADGQNVLSELRKKLPEIEWEKIEKMAFQLQAALEKIPGQMTSLLPPQFREDLILFADTAREMRKTFKEIDERLASLASENLDFLKKLSGLLETAERNQSQIDQILQKLNSPESSAGKMLQDKEFWEKTRDTLDKINEFLRELKANPKKYFKFSIF